MEMSKKRQATAIWITMVALLIGLGYWYGARPYIATTDCHHIALNNTGYSESDWQGWTGNSKNQTDYMFVYELCMHKAGFGS